jgi:hypothetical protein
MYSLKLSVSIMAHPKRKQFLPYLRKKLGDCPVSMDEGFGLWENAKRAWKMHDPKADYHVVIQDDAIVCNNFMEKALLVLEQSEKVFRKRPHICNFYYDKMLAPGNAEEIIQQGYITRGRIHWAVAICMPVELIDEMVAFGDSLGIPQDDERITAFMKSKNLRCYFPIPSLVNHRTDVPSLIGNNDSVERKAWRFIE